MIYSWIAAVVLVALVTFCTRRRPLWGLYAVMVSVPLSYKPALEGTPLYFLVELTLVPFGAVVLSNRRYLLRDLRRSPFLVFIPFLGFVALSTLWAQNAAAVAKEVIRWGEFVLMGWLGSCAIDREIGFDKPPSFLAWIGAIVSIVGITQFLEGINQNPFRPGAGAFFGHPNPTAAFLSLCILPMLGILVKKDEAT